MPPASINISDSTDRNAFWTTKYQEVQRYSHEHNEIPAWYRHEKHIIAFTNSGRPIFTRFGDESKLAQFVGVVSLISENFDKLGDKLRVMIAGNYKFVFLYRERVILLCITRTNETFTQIQRQLEYAYIQMVSVVSGKLNNLLKLDPKLEVRNYLAGTELLLSDLIDDSSRSISHILSCYQSLPLQYKIRSKIYSALKSATSKLKQKHVLSIVLCDQRIVCLQRLNTKSTGLDGTPDQLFIEDIHVLLNLFTNSQSLRTATDSWAPIFLPRISPCAFICFYMSYITDDLAIAILTRDPMSFDLCKDAKTEFVKSISSSSKPLLSNILQSGIAARSFTTDDIPTNCPELRHFSFVSKRCHQHFTTGVTEPYIIPTAWDLGLNEIIKRYKPVMNYLQSQALGTYDIRQYAKGYYYDANNTKVEEYYPIAVTENFKIPSSSILARDPTNPVCYQVSDDATVLGLIKPGEYEIYLTYTPLVSKESALIAAQKVIVWIAKEYNNLFNIY